MCDGNFTAESDCVECLPNFFHDNADTLNCDHECFNGTVSDDDLTCTCDDHHTVIDGTPGNCEKIDCYEGCADCDTHPSVDYSDCHSCETDNGYVDPDEIIKSPDEPRVCVQGCPTGYTTASLNPLSCTRDDNYADIEEPALNLPFNYPPNPEGGYPTLGDIEIEVQRDGNSGIPAKNRGLCMDGVMDGVLKADGVMLRSTFFADIWFLTWETSPGKTCTMCDKSSTMNFGINYNAGDENTMISSISDDGSHSLTTAQTTYVRTQTWYNLVFSYEDIDGKDTIARYYIDGALVGQETLQSQLILDSASRTTYLGAFYGGALSNGVDIYNNKCDACFYDFLITQTVYTPGGATDRTDDPSDIPEFWDSPIDEYVDDNGEHQPCHPNCTSGCVDG